VLLRLPPPVLAAYLQSGDWRGKAGGYGIQDPLLAPHIQVTGPWSNVVGLPLAATAALLRAGGVTARNPPDEAWLVRHNPFDDPGR
jgi:septum formation protein